MVAIPGNTPLLTVMPIGQIHNAVPQQSIILACQLQYLIDCGILGNSVYKQCVGIPMRTDCALLLKNLFLFHYEYKGN